MRLVIILLVIALWPGNLLAQSDKLSAELGALSVTLNIAQDRNAALESDVERLNGSLSDAHRTIQKKDRIIATLEARASEVDTQMALQIELLTSLEEQVALLLTQQDDLEAQVSSSDEVSAAEISEHEALQLALAQASSEVAENVEPARLAAAQREELEALITDLDAQLGSLTQQLTDLTEVLSFVGRTNAELESKVTLLVGYWSDALGTSQAQAGIIETLLEEMAKADARIASQIERLTSFEEQVALLLTQQDDLEAQVSSSEEVLAAKILQREALQLALVQARSEADETAEAARLAAAQREAFEALIADLRTHNETTEASLADLAARLKSTSTESNTLAAQLEALQVDLSDEERARLAEAAAAEALRQRLEQAGTELIAMTLALEDCRREAEETMTLLAAADAAGDNLNARLAAALFAQDGLNVKLQTEAERTAALDALLTTEAERAAALNAQIATEAEQRAALEARLAALLNDRDANALSAEELRAKLSAALVARLAAEQEIIMQLSEVERQQLLLAQVLTELSAVEAISADDSRSVTLLNEQVEVLRAQLSQLQGLLDDAQIRDSDAQVQIKALGSQLNQALAQVAAEQRARVETE